MNFEFIKPVEVLDEMCLNDLMRHYMLCNTFYLIYLPVVIEGVDEVTVNCPIPSLSDINRVREFAFSLRDYIESEHGLVL